MKQSHAYALQSFTFSWIKLEPISQVSGVPTQYTSFLRRHWQPLAWMILTKKTTEE